MSKKTVKDMITSALEDLQKKDLKKFKVKLCDRQEEPRVTRRSVEEADEMDLADLLVKICTEAKAAQQTIDLFTQLGFSDQAEKLRKGKTVHGDENDNCRRHNFDQLYSICRCKNTFLQIGKYKRPMLSIFQH